MVNISCLTRYFIHPRWLAGFLPSTVAPITRTWKKPIESRLHLAMPTANQIIQHNWPINHPITKIPPKEGRGTKPSGRTNINLHFKTKQSSPAIPKYHQYQSQWKTIPPHPRAWLSGFLATSGCAAGVIHGPFCVGECRQSESAKSYNCHDTNLSWFHPPFST